MASFEYTSFLFPNNGYHAHLDPNPSPAVNRHSWQNRFGFWLSHFPWDETHRTGAIDLLNTIPVSFFPAAVGLSDAETWPPFYVAMEHAALQPVTQAATLVGLRLADPTTPHVNFAIAGLGINAGPDLALFCPFADQTLPKDMGRPLAIPEIVNMSRDIQHTVLGDVTPAHLMAWTSHPLAQAS